MRIVQLLVNVQIYKAFNSIIIDVWINNWVLVWHFCKELLYFPIVFLREYFQKILNDIVISSRTLACKNWELSTPMSKTIDRIVNLILENILVLHNLDNLHISPLYFCYLKAMKILQYTVHSISRQLGMTVNFQTTWECLHYQCKEMILSTFSI